MTKEETKSEKFIRLAEKRVKSVRKYLRLIGYLANRSQYEYTDAQLDAIFRSIDEAAAECKDKFKPKDKKPKTDPDQFSLPEYEEEKASDEKVPHFIA